jgi:hypothetical protein
LATPRLFRLKAEVAPAPSGPVAQHLPVAKVLVDTGVFHLDQLYDYEVSEKLSASAVPGVRVQLPFGGRETEGSVFSFLLEDEKQKESSLKEHSRRKERASSNQLLRYCLRTQLPLKNLFAL